jgi:hypothetical protein
MRREQHPYHLSSQLKRSTKKISRHHSSKPVHQLFRTFRSPSIRKVRVTSPLLSMNKSRYHIDNMLAQRMQAAMSTELMHSLNRNFIVNDRKQSHQYSFFSRSHSFNICTLSNNYNQKLTRNAQHQMTSHARYPSNRDVVTPDYDEQTRTTTDDDRQATTITESDEKTCVTTMDRGVSSSSFIVLSSSTLPSNDDDSLLPPKPPPLPILTNEQKLSIPVRCRIIADFLSADHKLILKDHNDDGSPPVESNLSTSIVNERDHVDQKCVRSLFMLVLCHKNHRAYFNHRILIS